MPNAWKEDKKRQVETFCNKMSIKIRRCKPHGAKEKQLLHLWSTEPTLDLILSSKIKSGKII